MSIADEHLSTRRNATAEFYVGYLPTPQRQLRFLRIVVPCCLWLLCLIAYLAGRSQQSSGAGTWDQGMPVRIGGTFIAKPYPAILTDGERPELVLLVEVGKRGAAKRTTASTPHKVSVSGWPLHRDGRRMIELEPGSDAITPAPDSGPASVPLPRPQGRTALRGEIVDSKCFLGAMKPGEGKTHKECATLCIRGGIPPMFVTRDATGHPTYYLLTGPGNIPLDPSVYPFIGEPVEVVGELADWCGTQTLSIESAAIRRL